MELNIDHLRDALKKGKKFHQESYQRIQTQNVMLLRDINILRKEEVSILLQREMYQRLITWTKARLGWNNRQGQDDDELMETSDARDQILECQAEIEDMDEEISQLTYQQQEIMDRIEMMKRMQREQQQQRQAEQLQQMHQQQLQESSAPEGAPSNARQEPPGTQGADAIPNDASADAPGPENDGQDAMEQQPEEAAAEPAAQDDAAGDAEALPTEGAAEDADE